MNTGSSEMNTGIIEEATEESTIQFGTESDDESDLSIDDLEYYTDDPSSKPSTSHIWLSHDSRENYTNYNQTLFS